MTTGVQLISQALRSIGALGATETADGDTAANTLATLNQMLDAWSSNRLMIFTEGKLTHTLTGAGSYTIGSGGDIDTTRPVFIKEVFINNGSRDYGLTKIGETEYARVSNKTATSNLPSFYYYDGGFPLGTIRLTPLDTAGYTLNLYVRQPLSSIALDDTLSLPPAYEEAIKYNLGIRLAPEYQVQLSADYRDIAEDGRELIKRSNRLNNKLMTDVDIALLSNYYGFDVLTGYA